MTGNTKLIFAIADALIAEYGQDATEWLETGARADIECTVDAWCHAIDASRWIGRPEDDLVLRALRHAEHTVDILGGPGVEGLIRELVDEDWCGRRTDPTTRIGEVFAHELLRGDTGTPLDSIEYAWREHGSEIRGEDDEQPWNTAEPLSGRETRVEVCLAEARYVERRIPFLDLPARVRQAKAAANEGDHSGWMFVDESPVLRYVRAIREDGRYWRSADAGRW